MNLIINILQLVVYNISLTDIGLKPVRKAAIFIARNTLAPIC